MNMIPKATKALRTAPFLFIGACLYATCWLAMIGVAAVIAIGLLFTPA